MQPLMPHSMSNDEVIAHFTTHPEKGLSTAEIEKNLAQYGKNQLKPAKSRGPLRRLFDQFNNILIYILLVSAVIAGILNHWVDMSVILGVVILNAVIGYFQEGKAEKALNAIKDMLPVNATVMREGYWQTIAAEKLVPGDIVMLKAGDKVPADLRLIKSKSLQIQEAALTGESQPIEKEITPLPSDTPLADRNNMAYSSTFVTYGQGVGIVTDTGQETEIGHISKMVSEAQTLTTPLMRQMNRFGHVLTASIVLLGILGFVVGAFVWKDSMIEMLMASVALAVAAIPEGLPAIVTVTLAIGVTRMAKRHAIIRRLPAVETMGAVTTICTDKTGTLTLNELKADIAVSKEQTWRTPFEINENNEALLKAAILCNDAEYSLVDETWHVHGNPIDTALIHLANDLGMDLHKTAQNSPQLDIIPFESSHKFMATMHHDHAHQKQILIKGAPERILSLCQNDKSAEAIDRPFWQEKIDTLASEGKRLIGLAVKSISQEKDNLNFDDIDANFTFLGLIGVMDPPREEAKSAVRACQTAGINVKMITGDHLLTAKSIAKSVGILNTEEAITGQALDELDDEGLKAIATKTNVYARTTPEHKLRLVRALQENNEVVAMTGDGVNDAPALKQADIGVAMGQKGTEASKEASEMVLADDNFASITHAIEEGRTVYDNLKKAIVYILPTSFAEGFTVLLAILLGMQLPITAVQILWVNMITAVTLSISLAFEPKEEGIMERPPRNPKEPLLTPFLMWRILFVSLLLLLSTFGLFILENHLGTDLDTARTVVVNMLVMGEVVYVVNCRRLTHSTLNISGWFGSRAVLIAMGTVIFFQLLYTYLPVMQLFFNSTAIHTRSWLLIIVLSIATYLIIEIEKVLFRKRR